MYSYGTPRQISKDALFDCENARELARQKGTIKSIQQEEGQRNTLVQKRGMPHRVETLRKVDGSKDFPRTRLEFVKPIRNGVRKIRI